MEADDVLRIAVPVLAFAWCLYQLAQHPWGNYQPWRVIVGVIVLLGTCIGSYFLLRGDLLVAILGALVAGLVALVASRGLIEKMQDWESMTPAQQQAQQAAAPRLSELAVPALIGLLGLASALADQL